eukprot:ANDGO_04785.mRNA.1 hypothetical protein
MYASTFPVPLWNGYASFRFPVVTGAVFDAGSALRKVGFAPVAASTPTKPDHLQPQFKTSSILNATSAFERISANLYTNDVCYAMLTVSTESLQTKETFAVWTSIVLSGTHTSILVLEAPSSVDNFFRDTLLTFLDFVEAACLSSVVALLPPQEEQQGTQDNILRAFSYMGFSPVDRTTVAWSHTFKNTKNHDIILSYAV